MRPAKSIPTIVKRLTEHRPKNEDEIKALGIPLWYLGEGAFRTGYKVKGVPLVIKVPMCDCPEHYERCALECSGPNHSRIEYKVYQRIMKKRKYRALRGFLPRVHYFDDRTGIIAVQYYKPMSNTLGNQKLCDMIDQFIRQTLSIGGAVDMKPENIGIEIKDDAHQFKILDMGCIKRGF